MSDNAVEKQYVADLVETANHALDLRDARIAELTAQVGRLRAALEKAHAGLDAMLTTPGIGAAHDAAIGTAKDGRNAARAALAAEVGR